MRLHSYVLLSICVLSCIVNVAAKCGDLRSFDFANATYEIRSDSLLAAQPKSFRAKLRNGEYKVPHSPDFLAYFYAQLKSVRFGDLNKDGLDEAVVAVEYGTNSAAFFLTNYFVFGCSGQQVRLIGSIQQDRLDDQTAEILHESVREPVYISNGILHIRHGAGGSRPSPVFTMTFRYRISSGKLSALGRPMYSKNP